MEINLIKQSPIIITITFHTEYEDYDDARQAIIDYIFENMPSVMGDGTVMIDSMEVANE